MGKIEETCFTSYYPHSSKSNRIHTIGAYFIGYYPYSIISSRISTYNNCQ